MFSQTKEMAVACQHDEAQAQSVDTRDGTGHGDDKIEGIIAEQEEIFRRRQPESARMTERARRSLAGGVTSSWQITVPQPVWLSHGRGSKVYDVDGNEYVDLHGGYGAALAGHAHPAMVEAIRAQAGLGTHEPALGAGLADGEQGTLGCAGG